MHRFIAVLAITAMTATVAAADRPVTEAERTSLVAALKTEGCTGGEMEFDDGKFEIDNARCADGKVWDFEFDQSFKLVKKELED